VFYTYIVVMMKSKFYISLFEQANEQVNNRAFVRSLFSSNIDSDVVVDFMNIVFVSRSALHEFTVQKKRLKSFELNMEFKNMSVNVREMLDRVLVTNSNPQKQTKPISKVVEFDADNIGNFICI